MTLVGSVVGQSAILIDDITDTSDTLTHAAALCAANGATRIYAFITHAVLSGDATAALSASKLDRIFVSNTLPQTEHMRTSPKFSVFDVVPMFAEAIRRNHSGESVSYLFSPQAFG